MIAIHIGARKCGSSSIQSFLQNNSGPLGTISFDFPTVGRGSGKSHDNIAHEINGRDLFDPKLGSLDELSCCWRTGEYRHAILSSELFEETPPEGISRLRRAFARPGDAHDFKIIFVIRDLLGAIRSSYAKRVRFGDHTYNFDVFFPRRLNSDICDYYNTATRWADVFGWESMSVRILDGRHLTGGDLLEDFMAALDLKAEEKTQLQRTPVVNASPGWKSLEAVRALFGDRHGLDKEHPLRAFVKRRNSWKLIGNTAARVGAELGWNDEKGAYFTLSQAEACLDKYRRSIELLNLRLASKLPIPPDLSQQGFAERRFLPEAAQIPASELKAFYNEVARQLSERRKAKRRLIRQRPT